MKLIILLFLLFVAPVTTLFAQIGPAPVSSITTWRVEQSYSIGQAVIRNGVIYNSLVNSNIAYDPAGSPSQWGTTFAATSGSSITLTTTGTSGAATYSTGTLNIPQYQGALTLTTTGSSGAATLISNTLNIPQYSGGGTPGGSSTQAQFNNASAFGGAAGLTFRTADGSVSQFANVQYLSAGSDIGAQINTAVTALGNIGVIVLPYSTNIPMSTTATNIPAGISIVGYGKLASIINCTVAGDCFQFLMNPTTAGEIGSEVSNFEINGSGASNQVLMHFNGMSGYTLHDIQFEPYGGSGNAATCLEFDNSATGLFVEGNRTYNLFFERQCTTGVLFNQNAGDSSHSFGYNFFEFHVVATGPNYGVVFNGNGSIYGGKLSIFGNHNGPGGGILQFNNATSTGSCGSVTTSSSCEDLYVSAEENASGSGTLISATGNAVLSFSGVVNNGGGGANPLATTFGGSNIANFNLWTGIEFNTSGNGTVPALIVNGNLSGGGVGINVVGPAAQTSSDIQIDETAQTSGKKWQWGIQAGINIFYDPTDATTPLALIGTPTTFANLAKIGSNSQWCWGSTAEYANTNGTCDTSLSRISANVIGLGNGTQGDRSAELRVGLINVATARKGTFVCTGGGTITISNTNEALTSAVNISLNTAGGTITTPPAMLTATAGTGFTVLCGATDTSTYNYTIWD